MAGTAVHLVDDVLPRVAVRQWVLSFPHRVRYLLAYNPRWCAAVRRIFASVVLGWHELGAERVGIPAVRSGAVVFRQGLGSALNSNLHLHALLTDGVFCLPTDPGLARVLRRPRGRLLRRRRARAPAAELPAPTF